jgi:polyhydroxybutyrate depolymerase
MSTTRLIALLAVSGLCFGAGCQTKFSMAPVPGALGSGTGGSVIGPVGTAGTAPNTPGVGGAPGTAPITSATAGTASIGFAGTSATMTGASGTGAAPDGGVNLPMAGTMAGPTGSGAGGANGTSGAGGGGAVQPVMQTCPATSTLRPGETTETIQIGGVMRSYILHVPASYTGQTPVPLVLDWHGILLSSSLQRSVSGFAALSDSQGFIVAFPEGTDTAFNIGKCCTSSSTVDDLGFAKGLVSKLSQQGCIDQKRVHSVGYSMGGGMSMFLACNASDVFASIATSAFDLQPEADEPCKPSRAISVIDFRSTADPIVAYAGAKDTIPPNGTPTLVTFIGAEATLMKWGTLDGCTGSPQAQANGCQTYTQCNAGTEVTLCTKQGGGHDLMDPAPAWEFLKRHPMP